MKGNGDKRKRRKDLEILVKRIKDKNKSHDPGSLEDERKLIPGPSSGAVIGGILGSLALICITIGIVFFVRKRQADAGGPPKHKPPPPVKVKAGSSSEMLNKPSEPPTATEMAPLSPEEVYYEPTGGEPITNLDEENTGALNGANSRIVHGGAHSHHGYDMNSTNHETSAVNISRGESFVSPAMYV